MSSKDSHVVPKEQRLKEREKYGDVQSMFNAALLKRQEGDFEGAWTRLHMTVNDYLLLAWIDQSGKPATTIRDPAKLLLKLRSGLMIDTWWHQMILLILKRPIPVQDIHLELLEIVVRSFCLPNSADA